MLSFVCTVASLFFFSGTIKSMEECRTDARDISTAMWDGRIINTRENCLVKFPIVTKQKIKRYEAQGIDTIVINGGRPVKSGDAQCQRMQIKFMQKPDYDSSEEVIIQADKKAYPYIIVNHNGPHLEIGLRPEVHAIDLSRDISILLALKKYTKIVTNNYVDTTFLSPITSEKLHIAVRSGATMQAPSIKAKIIELLVEGDSLLDVQDKARFVAEDLLFIYRQGSAKITLDLETKLLQAQSNGNGEISLKGVAEKQELRFLEGSFFAFDVCSEHILIDMVEGSGTIRLSAEKSIVGVESLKKSNYDVEYRMYNIYGICIYPAEKELRYPV